MFILKLASGLPEFTMILCEICDSQSLVIFCVVSINSSVFVLLYFHLVIVLSGFLRITASNYF
jgi:hypothetical protein